MLDQTKYVPNADVVSTELEDSETVLLNLKTRVYYSINETGSVIWNRLHSGKSVPEIAESLTDEYEIELSEAISHVESFLSGLADNGLVDVE